MDKLEKEQLRYLTVSEIDEEWGIAVTTIGYQFIPPKGRYPSSHHPDQYDFKPPTGRILNEYQLVYITKGSGFFSSQSCKIRKIQGGTMIVLFPGEWHSYYPDQETGWDEYWVGFQGAYIDQQVEKGFFSKKEPLLPIRLSATIVGLYEEILSLALQEKSGYQQIISSIVLHILGTVYYKGKNKLFTNAEVVDKINQARIIMKKNIETPLTPEELANRLGMGYSWFRRIFKEYTGISPAKYQQQQRILRAKEYLTDTLLNVSEIAYRLGFENAGHFSTFFRQKEGSTPSEFREMVGLQVGKVD